MTEPPESTTETPNQAASAQARPIGFYRRLLLKHPYENLAYIAIPLLGIIVSVLTTRHYSGISAGNPPSAEVVPTSILHTNQAPNQTFAFSREPPPTAPENAKSTPTKMTPLLKTTPQAPVESTDKTAFAPSRPAKSATPKAGAQTNLIVPLPDHSTPDHPSSPALTVPAQSTPNEALDAPIQTLKRQIAMTSREDRSIELRRGIALLPPNEKLTSQDAVELLEGILDQQIRFDVLLNVIFPRLSKPLPADDVLPLLNELHPAERSELLMALQPCILRPVTNEESGSLVANSPYDQRTALRDLLRGPLSCPADPVIR